jgi:hypothetical protein
MPKRSPVFPCRTAGVCIAAVGALLAQAPAPLVAQGARDSSRTAAATSRGTSAIARTITGFAFDNVLRMGVGGFLAQRVIPVVLFTNGDALTDVEGLADPQGLAAHRQREPDSWTRWRRAGDRIELWRTGKQGSAWKPLPFKTLYTALPADFRLDGHYRSLGGTGNVAMGGGTMIAGWRDYRFYPDGRVERGGGSGGTVEGGGGRTTISAPAAQRTGRYRVEGLELVLRYDDGSEERRIIVADPESPTAIWLDGTGYTQPRERRSR